VYLVGVIRAGESRSLRHALARVALFFIRDFRHPERERIDRAEHRETAPCQETEPEARRQIAVGTPTFRWP
jgi:hypothetical protein